jgi:hypothetical protein
LPEESTWRIANDTRIKEICSIYGSVQNNALFISDSDKNDGPVFAIIPLDELDKKQPNFYISKDETGTDIHRKIIQFINRRIQMKFH